MSALHTLVAAAQEYVLQTESGEVISGTAHAMRFSDMGVIRWPITFCALMVVVLAVRSAWKLRSGEPEERPVARPTIDGSLFWGGYAMVLGILGTVVGITLAATAVEAVGVVEPALVWGGIKVALSSTIYGMLVFLASGLTWFGLRHWHRRAVLAQG